MRLLNIIVMIIIMAVSGWAGDNNEVAEYYLNKTDSVFQNESIFNADLKFSFKLTSIFTSTDYHGETEAVDTAVYLVHYADRKAESFEIIDSASNKNNSMPDSFAFRFPWNDDCDKFFFPNDTGGPRLAIGFESLDSTKQVFSGLVNLDRYEFRPLAVMINYSKIGEYLRMSETWNYDYDEPYITVVVYKTQSVKAGFLGKEYSQRYMIFSDYKFELAK